MLMYVQHMLWKFCVDAEVSLNGLGDLGGAHLNISLFYEYCSIHSLVNAITRQELNVEVLTHTSQLCARHHHLQMS